VNAGSGFSGLFQTGCVQLNVYSSAEPLNPVPLGLPVADKKDGSH